MVTWYIKRNDKQAGPLETAKIKQLALDGQIKPSDLIRRSDQETWHEAKSVKGLLIPDATSTVTQPPQLPEQPNQEPPPLPAAKPGVATFPWYHPLSLVIYALCFGGILFFAQQRQANRESIRKARNQVAAESQSRETADDAGAPSPSQTETGENLDSNLPANHPTKVFTRTELESIWGDRRLLAVCDMGYLTPSKLASYLKLKAGMEGDWRDDNSSTIANMYMLLLIPSNKWPEASRRIGLSRNEYIAVTKWTLLSAGVDEEDYEAKLQEMTGSTLQEYPMFPR